jgi:hypothetical protein
MVPLWLIEKASPRALQLFALLAARYADRATGEAWPSRKTLAEKLDVSLPTLDKTMAELVEIEAVEKAVRKREDGGNRSNVYRIKFAMPGGKADLPQGDQETWPELESLEPDRATSSEVALVERPKAVRVGGRDLPFDAIAKACGINPGSPRRKEIAVALTGSRTQIGIREQAWVEGPPLDMTLNPERYEIWLAESIRDRAVLWHQKMPGATLTPTALAKWWTDLPSLPEPRDGRSGSGADAVEIAEAAVRRTRGES